MSIESSLLAAGYEVSGTVPSGAAASQHCAMYAPDLVLMDVRLKGSMAGVEATGYIKQQYDLPVTSVAAYTDAGRAESIEPFGYIAKQLVQTT
jgi:two-component system, response regulator PdtaR